MRPDPGAGTGGGDIKPAHVPAVGCYESIGPYKVGGGEERAQQRVERLIVKLHPIDTSPQGRAYHLGRIRG